MLSAQITVMKFGGTSLKDREAFDRAAQILRSNAGGNLVVVVSAMSGVTDALIRSFQRAATGETSEALQLLEQLFERHLEVTTRSPVSRERMKGIIDHTRAEIIKLFDDVSSNRCTTVAGQDAMASHGERLSANLLTIILEQHGVNASYVDARRCLITDQEHGSARPLLEETRRRTRAEVWSFLEKKKVPVLGGFIGATMNGVTTTLGRGSSDYSATLFSAALGARETQIWTDVDGVMTADPRLVQSASTVSQLSYAEASELARLGAKVMHPKMIQPVIGQKIPIRILNSSAPEQTGTLICADARPNNAAVKAIANKANLSRIDITSTPAFVANGFLRAIEDIFDRHQARIQIVARSAVGISLACEESGNLPSLVCDLRQVGSVETKPKRAIVSCVGEGLQREASAENLRRFLREIDPTLTWHNMSGPSLISMVDVNLVGPVVQKLHQSLFKSEPPA